jgi:hypothetical protein
MKCRRPAAHRAVSLLASLFVSLVAALPASSQDAPAAAAPPANVYNIEIIIFRATQALGGAENWNVQTDTRESGTDGETADSSRRTGRFVTLLPESAFQLTPLESKLRSTGLYVPVAHVAWSQTASDWGTRAGFQLQRLGIEVPGLSGTVFLERGQFLHLGMALSYAPASPPAGMGAAPGTPFNLSQSRRIKYYERNYYDHPGFGVITLVTPAQGARPAGR